jgi:BirA family biotin operon repressor/biotin-[acetyl-CoA-carboxylase] ligase
MKRYGSILFMILTAERVHAALAPRPVRFYERVDSTNDLALEWLRTGAQTGSVVVADEQVKGRGRLGRAWYTLPGTALIVSIILHPSRSQIPHLTMLGAVAICELMEHIGIEDVGIKWPNDVQIGRRKVSGILPEVVWQEVKVEGAVLGMGINVRVDFTNTELADKAISIETLLGKPVNRLDLLVHLLDTMSYWTPKLGTRLLFHAWRERLTTLGQPVTSADGVVHGTAEDVDEDGALLLTALDGTHHRLIAGDIELGSVL